VQGTADLFMARYAFNAVGIRELSLTAGEIITVLMKSETGWYAGYKEVDNEVGGLAWQPCLHGL